MRSHAKDVLVMGDISCPILRQEQCFILQMECNRMALYDKNLFCNDFLNAKFFSRLQLELHDHMTSPEGTKLLSGAHPPSDTLA